MVDQKKAGKGLGMSVCLTFGPGWTFGGSWVKQEDRSQVLGATSVEVEGPDLFKQTLPQYDFNQSSLTSYTKMGRSPDAKLVAVVTGRLFEGQLQESSLIELTSKVKKRHLQWRVPEGHWRIMAFWLKYTETESSAKLPAPELVHRPLQ